MHFVQLTSLISVSAFGERDMSALNVSFDFQMCIECVDSLVSSINILQLNPTYLSNTKHFFKL